MNIQTPLPSIYQRLLLPMPQVRYANRRRRRWPMLLASFLLGLLTGWLLRGGGAGLP